MALYRPSVPFSTVLIVLKPTFSTVAGVRKKTLPNLEQGFQINASFKTFGGTEKTVDGIIVIDDTADVETWYRPDITSECVVVTQSGAKYEIINEPENIDQRNQFLKFRVRRYKGGI